MNAVASQISVSAILGRTWDIFRKQMPLFLGLTLVVNVLAALATSLLPTTSVTTLVTSLISMSCGYIVAGVISYAVFQALKDRPVTLGESVSRSMSRFVPLFLAALLTSLGVVLGMILLIIPGLILLCIWAVVIPACVVEGLSPVNSLKRSAELTKGHRWSVFGLMLLLGVLAVLFQGAVMLLLFSLINQPLVVVLIAAAASAIPSAFQNVMITIIYFTLRTIKEGVSIDNLADVFA